MDMKIKGELSSRMKCTQCSLFTKCMPHGLNVNEMTDIDALVTQRVKVKRGMSLFRQSSQFISMYVVRTGYFKTVISNENGSDQVLGFYTRSDYLGFGSALNEGHNCSAYALEDSEVCIIPYLKVDEIAKTIDSLQAHIRKLLSKEIARENFEMLTLGSLKAEGRIAIFLLNLSARHHERGYSRTDLNLSMSRQDIASFLGLTHETVTRALSKFIKDGMILVDNRSIVIVNHDMLHSAINREIS